MVLGWRQPSLDESPCPKADDSSTALPSSGHPSLRHYHELPSSCRSFDFDSHFPSHHVTLQRGRHTTNLDSYRIARPAPQTRRDAPTDLGDVARRLAGPGIDGDIPQDVRQLHPRRIATGSLLHLRRPTRWLSAMLQLQPGRLQVQAVR